MLTRKSFKRNAFEIFLFFVTSPLFFIILIVWEELCNLNKI